MDGACLGLVDKHGGGAEKNVGLRIPRAGETFCLGVGHLCESLQKKTCMAFLMPSTKFKKKVGLAKVGELKKQAPT